MGELAAVLEYIGRFGPWIALLGYYFFRLDRQLLRIIELLEDERNLMALRNRLHH